MALLVGYWPSSLTDKAFGFEGYEEVSTPACNSDVTERSQVREGTS